MLGLETGETAEAHGQGGDGQEGATKNAFEMMGVGSSVSEERRAARRGQWSQRIKKQWPSLGFHEVKEQAYWDKETERGERP